MRIFQYKNLYYNTEYVVSFQLYLSKSYLYTDIKGPTVWKPKDLINIHLHRLRKKCAALTWPLP